MLLQHATECKANDVDDDCHRHKGSHTASERVNEFASECWCCLLKVPICSFKTSNWRRQKKEQQNRKCQMWKRKKEGAKKEAMQWRQSLVSVISRPQQSFIEPTAQEALSCGLTMPAAAVAQLRKERSKRISKWPKGARSLTLSLCPRSRFPDLAAGGTPVGTRLPLAPLPGNSLSLSLSLS